MFFDSVSDLVRVAVVGTLAYASLVLLLRVSGKRTLSRMNAFDFVVTVALGSTLATALLSSEVSLLEGILAFATLIVLQFVVAWLSVRFDAVSRLVKAEPALLLYDGKLLAEALHKSRVRAGEVEQAARSEGFAALDEVHAVVMETDGSFSIIGKAQGREGVVGVKEPYEEPAFLVRRPPTRDN